VRMILTTPAADGKRILLLFSSRRPPVRPLAFRGRGITIGPFPASRSPSAFRCLEHLSRSRARSQPMSYDAESYQPDQPERSPAAARPRLPGILLLIGGILNLLGGGWALFMGFQASALPPEELRKAMQQNPMQKQQLEELEKQGYTPEKLKNMAVGFYYGVGAAAVGVALIIIVGGIRMRALPSPGRAGAAGGPSMSPS